MPAQAVAGERTTRPTMYVMVGLPASGKTTRAREHEAERVTARFRHGTRDDLRAGAAGPARLPRPVPGADAGRGLVPRGRSTAERAPDLDVEGGGALADVNLLTAPEARQQFIRHAARRPE